MLALLLTLSQTPAREPGFAAPRFTPLASVDFSPALNLLEQVRLRVDARGRVVKRRRTKAEIERERQCALILRAAQRIAHLLGE